MIIWFLLADQWLICFSQPMGNNLFGMTQMLLVDSI